MGLISEFKEFALKGNVVDMAIGVIIGAAFKDIVTSFTDSFINPLIASVGGAEIAGAIRLPWVDYSGLTMEEIQSLSLNYGAFITAIINFLLIAIVIFSIIKAINKFNKKKDAEPDPTTKVCPFCQSEISIKATKCPHCTSDLDK